MKQAPYSKTMDLIVSLLTFAIIALFISALIMENF